MLEFLSNITKGQWEYYESRLEKASWKVNLEKWSIISTNIEEVVYSEYYANTYWNCLYYFLQLFCFKMHTFTYLSHILKCPNSINYIDALFMIWIQTLFILMNFRCSDMNREWRDTFLCPV